MVNLPDDISIHVFRGYKLMDIYDKTTGFPRLDNILRTDGADRDGDFTANLKTVNLDEEWARNRNRDIELEIEKLREILNYNIIKLKPERVEKIEEEIENLLEERDAITFKYGLAGKVFNDMYDKNQEKNRVEKIIRDDFSEFTDDELLDAKLLARESHRPNWQASEFNRITSEMITLYSKKNTDYGDAFAQSLDEDGLLVSKIRLKDKLNRFAKLIENDALVNDESMRDTLIDMANYAVMTMMWLDENE